ncbi:hypothetical protein FSP39_020778 [Pinctada imbricata]|uniref:NAD(P)-binding domain-containing protein n=1 Tax=Pinctada imbricata TaxID=66713 RepID=A0AA89BPQ7_PINIB|nr:hypothetical protein FSP39_020778 [Pinctada imbricata]
MKIVVFGATGPSGLNLVQQALDRGMGVTALVRNPDRLTITHENLKVEKVNIFKEDEIVDHIKECDVVMGCLGSHGSFFSRLPENLYTESAKVILSAMRKANKKRFIVISAGGVIKTSQEPLIMTIFRPLRIREVLNNLREMEVMLENSTDIDFTAVRPPALSNAQVTGTM